MAINTLFSLVGWAYLPDLITRHLLTFLHSQPMLIPNPPQPRTPTYVQHYRFTFAFVVLAYLGYNLVQGARGVEANFYELLGVERAVDESGLRLAFRAFAKRYHPDKVGANGEQAFMFARDAFEALKDPVVRFAYDRFGPDVLHWSRLSTPREYLHHGLLRSVGYHIVTLITLFVLSSIGRPSPVAFWRYLLFVGFLSMEVAVLLAPTPSSFDTSMWASSPDTSTALLNSLFPRRVAYQHVLFLHQLFLFLSMAISRVAPTLFLPPPPPPDKVSTLSQIANREATILLQTELHSIQPSLEHKRLQPITEVDEAVMEGLAQEMENMIIETNVRKDTGPLRTAWEAAIQNANHVNLNQNHPTLAPNQPLHSLEIPQLLRTPGGTLPSPRPSPPPYPRSGSSYTRARSVSLGY
ncbi:DnaJ-domain-containing protein [Hymenopellis radicata]|nr:DnaJ-domain-containing protein [Hymenopellis radicata]